MKINFERPGISQAVARRITTFGRILKCVTGPHP
jgi:hypothetical protein